MTHITCRLTAKNRDQLQNPTLGNRVWATFTFFTFFTCCLLLFYYFGAVVICCVMYFRFCGRRQVCPQSDNRPGKATQAMSILKKTHQGAAPGRRRGLMSTIALLVIKHTTVNKNQATHLLSLFCSLLLSGRQLLSVRQVVDGNGKKHVQQRVLTCAVKQYIHSHQTQHHSLKTITDGNTHGYIIDILLSRLSRSEVYGTKVCRKL